MPESQADDADTLLVRVNADGSPDATFGPAGRRVVDLSGNGTDDKAADVAVDGQGRLLVAGTLERPREGRPAWAGTEVFSLARFAADGTLDAAFGAGGVATAAFGPVRSVGRRVVVLPDGRILVGGTEEQVELIDASYARFALARFNADGTPDSTFGGGDGMVSANVDNWATALASMSVDAQGRTTVAGSTIGEINDLPLAFARFTPDGELDPTFFGDGSALYDPGRMLMGASDAAMAADGTLSVVGQVSELDAGSMPTDRQVALVRLAPGGTFDLSATEVDVGPGGFDHAAALAILPDGRS